MFKFTARGPSVENGPVTVGYPGPTRDRAGGARAQSRPGAAGRCARSSARAASDFRVKLVPPWPASTGKGTSWHAGHGKLTEDGGTCGLP